MGSRTTLKMLRQMDQLLTFMNKLKQTDDDDERRCRVDLRDRLQEALELLEVVVPPLHPRKKRKTVSSFKNFEHSFPSKLLRQSQKEDFWEKRCEALTVAISKDPPAPAIAVVALIQGTENRSFPTNLRPEDAALKRVIVGYEWSDETDWVCTTNIIIILKYPDTCHPVEHTGPLL